MPAVAPGTIVRRTRDGRPRYGVKVYDPSVHNGRWVGTFDTAEQARAAKRRAEAGRHSGEAVTVDEYFASWAALHPRPAESTMDRYTASIKPFLKRFGKRKLHSITRVEALEWAASVPCSVTDAVRVLLNDARNDGLLTYNPFSDLRRKRPPGRQNLDVISTRELAYLADTAADVWPGEMGVTMRALILWAAYTAMRPSEIFALKWHWLDFRSHLVAILEQLDRRGHAKPLKNGEPRIAVMLPEAAAAIQTVPRHLDVSDIVFTTARNCVFSESKLNHYWTPVRAAFGKPEMDFYELRHYCATLMLENGVSPGDVAVQLGHKDGGLLVMKTYGHPSEDAARERILRLMARRTSDISPSKSAGFRSQAARSHVES